MATISVALATYNGASFIGEQLRSILAQTRKPTEIVISDDGSSDRTLAIAEQILSSSDIPYRFERNPGTRGSTGNFEHAVRMCCGEIVFLCDQDDSWVPEKIEIQAKVMEDDPSLGFCFSNAALVDDGLQPMGKDLWTSLKLHSLVQRFATDQTGTLIRRPLVTGSASAFRKYALEAAMPFDPGWIHDRWASLVCSCLGIHGKSIPSELFLYRQHSSQQVSALADQTFSRRFQFVRGVSSEACLKDSRRWLSVHRRLKLHGASAAVLSEVMATAIHLRIRARIRRSGFLSRLKWAEAERRRGRYQFSSFPESWLRDILIGQG